MEIVRMPNLGRRVIQGTIVEWFKNGGDTVSEGEPLFSIEANKAEITCNAPASGVLRGIRYAEGTTVVCGDAVGFIGDESESIPSVEPVRTCSCDAESVERVPLTRMREVIAERMSRSHRDAPHYYITIEVDMTACAEYRSQSERPRPSYNDLIMLAVAQTLPKYPVVNARWDGDAVELVQDVNLGMAVAVEDGLVVPVVKKAQAMSLSVLHDECARLAKGAQSGTLPPDEYAGNTFTVSNLGAFGVDHFSAIINPPDSAILAVGQVKDTPVAVKGAVEIRPLCKMTLSSDHRVIDGAPAARFLGQLKKNLERGRFE